MQSGPGNSGGDTGDNSATTNDTQAMATVATTNTPTEDPGQVAQPAPVPAPKGKLPTPAPAPAPKMKPEDAVMKFLGKILSLLKRKKKLKDELILMENVGGGSLNFNQKDLDFFKKLATDFMKLLQNQNENTDKSNPNRTLDLDQRTSLKNNIIDPTIKEMEDALKKDAEQADDLQAEETRLEEKHDEEEEEDENLADKLDPQEKVNMKDALADTFESDGFKAFVKEETGLDKDQDKEIIEDLGEKLHDEAAAPDSALTDTPTLEMGGGSASGG